MINVLIGNPILDPDDWLVDGSCVDVLRLPSGAERSVRLQRRRADDLLGGAAASAVHGDGGGMAVAEIQYGLPWIIAGHLTAIGFDVQSAIVQWGGGVLADGVLTEDDGHQSVGSDRVRAEIVVERARHGGTGAVESRDMVSKHVVVFGDASLGYDELRVKTELRYLRAVIE